MNDEQLETLLKRIHEAALKAIEWLQDGDTANALNALEYIEFNARETDEEHQVTA